MVVAWVRGPGSLQGVIARAPALTKPRPVHGRALALATRTGSRSLVGGHNRSLFSLRGSGTGGMSSSG